MPSRICVKNLSKSTGEKELREVFSKKGEITDIKLMKTAVGISRGFAFIGFRNDLQAQEATSYFNNTFITSSRICVELAKKVGDAELTSAKSKYAKKPPPTKIEDAKRDKEGTEKKVNKATPDDMKVDAGIVKDKDKLDFLEAMKHRKDAQFWANDTSIPVVEESYPVGFRSSSSEDESDDVDSEKNSVSEHQESVPRGVKSVSHLDYFKSKWTDSESDSDSDSDSNSSDSHVQKKRRKIKLEDAQLLDDQELSEEEIGEDHHHSVMVAGDEDDELDDTGRLFVRNLPFSCSEEELKDQFESFGPLSSVHITLDSDKRSKGYGFVHFLIPEDAEKAIGALDGSSFQGRIMHIIRAKRTKVEKPAELIGTTKGPKLSAYQLKREEERKKLAGKKEGWNAAFVRSDTVVDSLADRFGMKRSDIMDTSSAGGDLAVRLAIGEAKIVQENTDYFREHGVNLAAIESHFSGNKASKRSDTTLLVKNLPHDTNDLELESMFGRFGSVVKCLIPPSKSVALVEFVEPLEARVAFKKLAYRKYKHQPLYIEWAPVDVISKGSTAKILKATGIEHISSSDPISVGEVNSAVDFGTLFVKNLSFSTTEDGIRQHCINIGCRSQSIRAISIPKTRKGDAVLSLGYGFIEFCNLDEMQAALKRLHGSVLDSRALDAKPSEKRLSVVSAVSVRTSKTSQQKNDTQAYKLIVRNLAFQANQKELLSLFSTFGQVKKVRIPKKVGGQHRGFAFVDYTTHQEAVNAMTALSSSHLYGRHLVIEWAKDDEEDIDQLRKRAKIDVAAITVDKKRRKDEVKAIEAGAEEDNIDEGDL